MAVAAVYDGNVGSNLDGGTNRGTTYGGVFHLRVSFNGDRLLGWPGATAFLDGFAAHDGHLDALVGDAQGVSNIAAPPGFELYEAWLQYNFSDSQYSVLLGRYDLNTEFYRLNAAGLFLNSSFGMGPEFAQSGLSGPSIFPDTSLGIRLGYKPTLNTVIRFGVLDGVPVNRPSGSPGLFADSDGLLLVSEVALLDRPAPDIAPGNLRSLIGRASGLAPYGSKVAFGGWYYTASYDDLSEVTASGAAQHRGSGGAYILVDRLLYESLIDPKRHISGFVEAGIGDNRVNRFGSYFGYGLTFTGFISRRPSDEMGFAVAIGNSSSHFRQAHSSLGMPIDKSEMTLELTYLTQISNWLALQPDIQYVINPNTNPSVRDAIVIQLKFEVSL